MSKDVNNLTLTKKLYRTFLFFFTIKYLQLNYNVKIINASADVYF